jgi:hypothetical protein
MGLTESTLKAQTVKPLVRPDSTAPLPSLTLESAKFTDGTVGFLVTSVDLAKNTTSVSYVLSTLYSPSENTYTFNCQDDSVFTFLKDRLSDKVCCIINRVNSNSTVTRLCVTTYEPLGDERIDKIAQLYDIKPTPVAS